MKSSKSTYSVRAMLIRLSNEKTCNLSPLEIMGNVAFATYKKGEFEKVDLKKADEFGHPSTGWYFIPNRSEKRPIRFFTSQINPEIMQSESHLGILPLREGCDLRLSNTPCYSAPNKENLSRILGESN